MNRRGLATITALLALLSGCAAPVPQPLTLPAADGRATEVRIDDGYRYVVTAQALDQAQGGVVLRVTRATAPELDYSEGLAAKRAAEAYCAGYNRRLNPSAFGKFSVPATWLFEGGCL